MDLLSGVKLIKPDNTAVEAPKVLASKKLVLFYFSAHWCPPCRMFTPMLRDFYEEAAGLGVEIVFISSDRSQDAMMGYMKESHGPWWALEHNSDIGHQISSKYNISSIPTLLVFKADGTLVTLNGRDMVASKDPAQLVKLWLN
eukprot:TRINITY_DN14835_c0_g1_i1.p1 TRINITY_DN14835_c0_g1~~TRINITY_DN14835_c0_g1_i1.p1  ORF type:complete len:143 (-),score=30.09 TRINITY_DN14835_c0_g1_i1:14-442(-)